MKNSSLMESAKFTPRTNTKSKRKLVCTVKSCNSIFNKDLDLCFHYFPIKKKNLLEEWMKAVGIERVNSGMKICSRHFHRDDYILPDVPTKMRRLKKIAVPSLNLPNSSNERKVRILKRNVKETNPTEMVQQIEPTKSDQPVVYKENLSERVQDVAKVITSQPLLQTKVMKSDQPVVYKKNVPNRAPDLSKLNTSGEQNGSTLCEKCRSSSTRDVEVQVETMFFKSSLTDMLKDDVQLNAFTGIESFAILNTIVEIVSLNFGSRLKHHNVRMSIRDKVVMTYVKLKQNLPYSCLGVLFDCCSESTCRRVFFEMIKILSLCLRGMIKLLSLGTDAANLPLHFEEPEDTRVVLDCVEVSMQQPENPEVDTRSSGQKGEPPDKITLNDCDSKESLASSNSMTIDGDSHIEDECEANKGITYRPPFLNGKKQFSKAESTETAKVKKAKIHIEHSNPRIRTFKIMSETVPSFLLPIMDDIVTVISATVNLGSPYIENKKFMRTMSNETNQT